MSEELIPFGETLPDQNPERLTIDSARRSAAAVADHPDFTFVEARALKHGSGESEILIVDCRTDGVWSKNPIGIRYRERLALRFFRDAKRMPEVRALRRDFPFTLHQSHVEVGEPTLLCVYFEPWTAVERTWTPQKYLARIQWWLTETANGTLHRADQPPEQLYFESPITLVLPPDFDEKISNKDLGVTLEARIPQDSLKCVLTSSFKPVTECKRSGAIPYACVALVLPAISHAPVERFPSTLGELHDQLESRGAPIAEALFLEIQRIAEGAGLPTVSGQRTLLILSVPIFNPTGDASRFERKGFIIMEELGQLGVSAGVLFHLNGKYRKVVTIGGLKLEPGWRDAKLHPLEVVRPFTEERARLYSGVAQPGPVGVLAGVGALGSALANIWTREGWGQWTYIDPDFLLPHNLARHTGYENQVGLPKIDIVRQLEGTLYVGREPGLGIFASANDFDNAQVIAALQTTKLVVDATTTFEVPRNLASNDSVGRSLSAFLTPSGRDSVLLMEDEARNIRLDVLEAQYYRLVLNASWGDQHLEGHRGNVWVGAGCRDVSNVISGELIQMHAALLARQIRLRSALPQSLIQVWRCDADTGAVATTVFAATSPILSELHDLQLVWDEGLRAKIRAFRKEGLPRETGGVLLGFFDLKSSRVYVVDALPAPPDSVRSQTEFARGIAGLEAAVKNAQQRTGNVVSYVGEWHSHPRGVEPSPSHRDLGLLVHLALFLHQDGLPALMLIVGDEAEQWMIASVRQ